MQINGQDLTCVAIFDFIVFVQLNLIVLRNGGGHAGAQTGLFQGSVGFMKKGHFDRHFI